MTVHLRRRLAGEPGADPGRETLTVIPARDGRAFWEGEDGHKWRDTYANGSRTQHIGTIIYS